LLFHEYDKELLTISLISFASLLIIVMHRENIRRLLAGTENRLGPKLS
jgi:glycerol-3-phosphate acyltransferase PlsY